ncbi:ELYS beta-propeller domain [Trinorchestia longiramus]|nr:ELYS beta-propeller domain [Trinorchestia longiramus]
MTDNFSKCSLSMIVENKPTLCSPLTLSAFKNGLSVPLFKILHPNNGLRSYTQSDETVRLAMNYLTEFLVLPCKRKLQYITSSVDKDQVLRETFDKVQTLQQKNVFLLVDQIQIHPTVSFSDGLLSGMAENNRDCKTTSILITGRQGTVRVKERQYSDDYYTHSICCQPFRERLAEEWSPSDFCQEGPVTMAGDLSLVLSAEASYHASLPALSNIIPEACPAMYPLQPKVLGGYLSSGSQLVWRAYGPTVEVLDSSSGTRLAAWTFGAILRSLEAKVLSVCGVGCSPGTITHIVCGVDRGPEASPRGLAAVLSLATSKIVRAFLFPNAVVQVSTITGGPAWVDVCTLHPALRYCSPLVVVASDLPSLHLLDLALDVSDIEGSDEVSPASLGSPPPPAYTSASLLQHRLSALKQRIHLSVTLIDGSVCGNKFSLLGPNDAVLCQLPAESVAVTALLYIPQIASLAIGYNFGAFQLYNLCGLAIDCASPYEEGVPGVISFAYQEPENDPRNCVYLWLCRSITPDAFQSQESSGAVCTLYSMTYEKREWIEGHGLSYQGLSAISPRFEFEADGSPQGGCEGCPTVLFTSHTITRPSPPTTPPPLASCPPSLLLGATDDEGSSGHVSDLSLCLFGWYSRTRDERGRSFTQHFVALFDINQWYQAQMPGSVRLTPGKLCPYFSFHQLNRVPCGANERVLAASPLTTCNITRHMAPAGSSERDWYPASLSYGVGVLSSSGTAWYQCRSSQQSCLRWLLAQGPAAVIMCPDEAVARCSFAGLSTESDLSSPRLNSKKSDRETVLEVCLSQHLLSVLSECVSEFSEGRFASLGCTLPSLLHWAWDRVTDTKTDIDALLSRLFSCGDAQLTPEQLQRLHHSLTVLGCLRSVLALCAQHTPITTRHAGGGRGEVSAYAMVVSLLHQHLTVTLWFQHCQLLPEINPSLAMEDSSAVPYPALPLTQIYHNRRQEISELSPHVGGKDLLMIDLLMEELGVKSIADWGEGGPPVYPPPSLQALLNIYLLADVDISLKHRIVQYLFLDLSSILTNGFSSAVEQLIKFPASAKLSPSIIKLTQAFWLLDQKDFQSAVDLFLDPLVVRTDITPAQHRRIIRALLCQNEAHLSLCYSEGRKPPRQQLEDVQLQLFVLLANGRVREAFHYQRTHATVNNSDRLLQHLLQGCELYGHLQEVLQLPLLANEESAFVKFLQDSEQPLAKHILTVACLRSNRYSNTGPASFPENKQKQAARTALLHCYSTHLQAIQPPSAIQAGHKRSEYSARQPLSACLRQAALSPLTKSKTFQARLSFAPQYDQPPQLEPFTPFRSRAERLQKRREAELAKSECSLLFPSRLLEGSRLSGAVEASPARLSSLCNVSAHITALLSTPSAPRRARPSLLSRAPSTTDSTISSTPQSILKVRSLLKRPMSPCGTSGDLLVLPPPRSTPRLSLPNKVLEEDGGASDSSCLTPKQLRFALPTPPCQEASNDASVDGGADAAKTSVPADGDSDDHSDLDVQLEPYINLKAKMAAASSTALYEEQESWELMGDQSLPTEHRPSFSGVLLQASKSEQSFALDDVKNSSIVDPTDDLDSTVSDANENFFSFESDDVGEQNKTDGPNIVCVEEQETDDEENLPVSDGKEHQANDRLDQNKSVSAEKPIVEPKEKETSKALSPAFGQIGNVPNNAINVRNIPIEAHEERRSEDHVITAVPKSNSWVEEQSSQDATEVSLGLISSQAENLLGGTAVAVSKLQQLHEISAEYVEACLNEGNTESLPIAKPSLSGLLVSNKDASSGKRRRDSSSSISEEETDGRRPPSKTAKYVLETTKSIVSTQVRETEYSSQFPASDNESTYTMEKDSSKKMKFLKEVVTTSHEESSFVKKAEAASKSPIAIKDQIPTFLFSPLLKDKTPELGKKSPSLKKPPTPSREVVKERIREVVNKLQFSDSEDSSSEETDLIPPVTDACSTKSSALVEVQCVERSVSKSPLISEQSDEGATVTDSQPQSTLGVSEQQSTLGVSEPQSTLGVSEPQSTLGVSEPQSTFRVSGPQSTLGVSSSTPLKTTVSSGSVTSELIYSNKGTPKRNRRLSGIDPSNIIVASSATPLKNKSSSRIDVSNILEPPIEFGNSSSRPSTPLRRSSRRPVGESPALVTDVNKLKDDDTVQAAVENACAKDATNTPRTAVHGTEQIDKTPTTTTLVETCVDNSVLKQREIEIPKQQMPEESNNDPTSASIEIPKQMCEESNNDPISASIQIPKQQMPEESNNDPTSASFEIPKQLREESNNDPTSASIEIPKQQMPEESNNGPISADIDEIISATQPLVAKEVNDPNSRSPSRQGRLSSLDEVPKLVSPATPLRRSSRRSVTPSKFGTPVLPSITEKSEQKTPQKLFYPADDDSESVPGDLLMADAESGVKTPSSARKGRRKSIDLSTPIKSPATPLRRCRRGTTPVSDSLQVIEEVEGEITEDEPPAETTPSKIHAVKNRRKSRRSFAAPDLQPIDEDEELASTSSVTKIPQSKQESKLVIASPTLEKNSPETGVSRSSVKIRNLTGVTSDSEVTKLETTKSRRGIRVSSASTEKESGLRQSLTSMKLLKADISEDEDPVAKKTHRLSRRRSTLPPDSNVVMVDTDHDADDDDLPEEELESGSEYLTDAGDNLESDGGHGTEEEVKGTRMRSLRKGTNVTGTELKPSNASDRRKSTASSGAVGRRVGIKRPRRSMRLTASETEEEEDTTPDVGSRPKRQRRSAKTDSK